MIKLAEATAKYPFVETLFWGLRLKDFSEIFAVRVVLSEYGKETTGTRHA